MIYSKNMSLKASHANGHIYLAFEVEIFTVLSKNFSLIMIATYFAFMTEKYVALWQNNTTLFATYSSYKNALLLK